jgi:hypothetical protein
MLKQRSYIIYSERYHDYSKNKVPHIINLKNKHSKNQSFPNKYGCILQGKIK